MFTVIVTYKSGSQVNVNGFNSIFTANVFAGAAWVWEDKSVEETTVIDTETGEVITCWNRGGCYFTAEDSEAITKVVLD